MTLERIDIADCEDRLQVSLHRARYDFVLTRLPPGQKVLEIGVGAATFTEELLPRCKEYVGVEYDHDTCLLACKKTAGKAKIVQADARNLPFGKDEFSFIVCLEVLEHLGDYRAGVNNIHRCLRPEGVTIISVPYRRIGGRSKTNEYHPYEPGERELVSLLKQLFVKVEVYYQYFEETRWMTLARTFHIRRLLGLHHIYGDLSAGQPWATARLRLDRKPKGMKVGLVIVAGGKK